MSTLSIIKKKSVSLSEKQLLDAKVLLVKMNSDHSFMIRENYYEALNQYISSLLGKRVDLSTPKHISIVQELIRRFPKIGLIMIIVFHSAKSFVLSTKSDHEYQLRMELNGYLLQSAAPVLQNIDDLKIYTGSNGNYNFCYSNRNNRELFTRMAQVLLKICPDLGANLIRWKKLAARRSKSKAIKVGFITLSHFLIQSHSVSKDRLGVIKGLSENPDFEVVAISGGEKRCDSSFLELFPDLKSLKRIDFTSDSSLSDVRSRIADECFDIIIYPEIGMCPTTRLLCFSRLAPVQINTWGHSETSGIPNIDFYVSSKLWNKPSDQKYFSEKLILFDSSGTYYYNRIKRLLTPEFLDQSDRIRSNWIDCISNLKIEKPVFYGFLQVYRKMNEEMIDLIDQILKQDTNAIIILLDTSEQKIDFRDYVLSKLSKHSPRIIFVPVIPWETFLQTIKATDLVIDYYPFGGFNSSMETFALSKIIVTLPSDKLSGRFTLGLYRQLEIDRFVAKNLEDLKELAIYYGNNPSERGPLEDLISNRLNRIFETRESIDEYVKFLADVYQQYGNA
jgi:predicted O-linked N-acetylglucosamine transferase (SPINDLY family)